MDDAERPFIFLRDGMFAEVKDNWRILYVQQVADDPARFRIGGNDYDQFGEPLTEGAPPVVARCDFRATPKHGNREVMRDFAKRLGEQRSGRPPIQRRPAAYPIYPEGAWRPDMKLKDAPRDIVLSFGRRTGPPVITTPAELIGEGRFSGELTFQDIFDILSHE